MKITTKRLILNPISKTIPENFLAYNKIVETLILKEGFTMIEEYAFSNCTNLKTVYLPESLKTIEYGAFCRCASLTEIEIPNKVETIERLVFHGCTNLKEIIIDNTEEFVEQNWDRDWKSLCEAKITYLR
jgi:ectoine hydroxylase-related dioxygenase (phytanoyl-CoA dioxygenase family)